MSPRKIAGVEVRLSEQGQYACDYIIAENKSGKLGIEGQSEQSIPLEGIMMELPKGIPVCIVLGGKGVMTKKSPELPNDTALSVGELFPNIQTSDFVFQHIHLTKGMMMALARQGTIDTLLAEFEKAGHYVLSVDLAFGSAPPAISIVKPQQQELSTSQWLLTIGQEGVTDARFNASTAPVSFRFGGLMLQKVHFLAFAACFNAFVCIGTELQNAPSLLSSKRNYHHSQLLRLFGIGFLGALLLALLANAMIYFSLDEKLQRQSVALAAHGENATLLDSLQKAHKAQQLFLEENSLQKLSISGWYADQIGSSMVSGIQLSKLDIFPQKQTSNRTASEKAAIEFERNLILIAGTSAQSYQLNEWIKKLKSLPWISEVKVMPYSENQAGKGSFELQVKVKG